MSKEISTCRYYHVEFETSCPHDDCKGRVEGTGWADSKAGGEIVKFIYQECLKCGWDQGS